MVTTATTGVSTTNATASSPLASPTTPFPPSHNPATTTPDTHPGPEPTSATSYNQLVTARAHPEAPLLDDAMAKPAPVAEKAATSGAPTNGSENTFRIVSLPKRLPNAPESHEEFCSNVVITSKYTTWNFLPKFLAESFKKLANVYFLLVSVLQCIPAISNTGGLPTNLPVLMFILAVDAVLAIIEDRRRHLADKEANSAKCQVVTRTYQGPATLLDSAPDPEISVIHWSELTVGTVVKLRNRETAPADLLILSVDEPDPNDPCGICYVETKSLDGETNLKLRQACEGTVYAISAHQVASLEGFLQCENPNRVINRFDGSLTVRSSKPSEKTGDQTAAEIMKLPLSIKNVMLRGCQLRNTAWMYGLVINTGPDTKIMQSAAKPRPKWSSINETVNQMIVGLFLLLCTFCTIATSMQIYWLSTNKIDTEYLQWTPNKVSQWFIGFGYYFLLMYQMIPVSLYVTISMVMFIQAIFMTMDIDMYYEELDVRMIVRTMSLNEELGQISYVFSDKTGTLTCNVMEFRKCSINGVSYGTGTTEIGRAALKRKGISVPEEPKGKNSRAGKVPFVNFEDPKLVTKLQKSETISKEAEFFLHLSLCQTVIPEVAEGSSEVRFSASSPDEQALVSGAKYFGFAFESRGLGIARVRVSNPAMLKDKSSKSELMEFKILEVFEFTSDRKRMSVVVQYPNGEYWVLTKGADNVIYPLLSKTKNDSQLMEATLGHLETFGDDGLRTLTIASRKLDPTTYEQWSLSYKEATNSLDELEKRKQGQPNRIDELVAEVERDLILLGATAIEDKLQDNVPRAIANLMEGGMKVWMLTGDKQETAINISFACQLMDNDMTQLIYNCDLYPTKEPLLKNLLAENAKTGDAMGRRAVVIDGECLEMALEDETCRHEFLKLAMGCEAVVCCRVSPSQKAEVVTLVRENNKTARTLAIGDGANDVAMIQRAHVGVGICGQEGMQAVNSSDYAIGQFYFLEKLLLHHGRLNYKRMSILAGYMFYKNIVMVISQYLYMSWTGWSGQKFYSELAFQLYNICYTSLPIIFLGVFDYDVPWSVGRRFPRLYLVGPRMELFNKFTFFKWVASAIYESFVIFLFVTYGFNDDEHAVGSTHMSQMGLLTFTLVVLITNLRFINLQMSWTYLGAACWFLGVLSYIPFSIIVSSYWVSLFPTDFGSFQNTLSMWSFWFVLPICCVVALLRNFTWTAFQRAFYPVEWQVAQEQYVLNIVPGESSTAPTDDIEANSGDSHMQDHYYQSSTSPAILHSHGDRPSGSQRDSASSDRKHRVSGYAYSYDAESTSAEAYMTVHGMHSVSSAIAEAEHHGRRSREDSRSSNFDDVDAKPRQSSSTGLFV